MKIDDLKESNLDDYFPLQFIVKTGPRYTGKSRYVRSLRFADTIEKSMYDFYDQHIPIRARGHASEALIKYVDNKSQAFIFDEDYLHYFGSLFSKGYLVKIPVNSLNESKNEKYAIKTGPRWTGKPSYIEHFIVVLPTQLLVLKSKGYKIIRFSDGLKIAFKTTTDADKSLEMNQLYHDLHPERVKELFDRDYLVKVPI